MKLLPTKQLFQERKIVNIMPSSFFFQACLASIIIVALKGMFLQLKDLKNLWTLDKYDFVSMSLS